jgi:hypothetical protein
MEQLAHHDRAVSAQLQTLRRENSRLVQKIRGLKDASRAHASSANSETVGETVGASGQFDGARTDPDPSDGPDAGTRPLRPRAGGNDGAGRASPAAHGGEPPGGSGFSGDGEPSGGSGFSGGGPAERENAAREKGSARAVDAGALERKIALLQAELSEMRRAGGVVAVAEARALSDRLQLQLAEAEALARERERLARFFSEHLEARRWSA